jgi:hypothetical protein
VAPAATNTAAVRRANTIVVVWAKASMWRVSVPEGTDSPASSTAAAVAAPAAADVNVIATKSAPLSNWTVASRVS